MARSVTRKVPTSRPPKAAVVRAEKAIPAIDIERSTAHKDSPGPTPSQCTGRCGHCDLDPCQLHAPI